MRSIALLFAFMLCVSVAAVAQGAAVDLSTPEAVVRGYSAAMKARRVADMVGFIHPAVLDTFKTTVMSVLEDAAGSRNKEAQKIFAGFGGGKSIEDLRAMNSVEFTVELESMAEALVGWYHASDEGTNKGDW